MSDEYDTLHGYAEMNGKLVTEIEALRAENARLREEHEAQADMWHQNYNDAYKTIEQLKAALKPLAEMELWTDAYPDGPLEATTKERFVDPRWVVAARAAIGESDV